MERQPKKVLVAGGGISGLSAAYYMKKWSERSGYPVDLTIVEQSERWGGKIRTMHRDGFVIERGPDSFLARKLPIIDLTVDLGLEHELAAMNPKASQTYIVSRGRLHPMPRGLALGIPTQWKPFLTTGLLSPAGKLRAAADLFLPKRKEAADESLGNFLERRLGREVLERIVEPLLAGIYAGDTHRLSLMATFPQFREAERKYGSLIRGTMMTRQNQMNGSKQTNNEAASTRLPVAVQNSMFLTYRNGLSTLVDALIAALKISTRMLNHCAVTDINRKSDMIEDGYHVTFADGTTERFDAIIFTLPNDVTAKLLHSVPGTPLLGQMPYVSVANVIMAFRKEDIEHGLDGSGFLVPRSEGRLITACTWTSRKWLHTAPEGYELLRCYIGRSGAEDWQQLTDEQLLQGVRKDLQDLTGLAAVPLFYEVTRLPRSMPQYPVGHLEQIKNMREQLNLHMPGVAVTGAGFHGVGIPDCIRQGKEAAEQISSFLESFAAGYK